MATVAKSVLGGLVNDRTSVSGAKLWGKKIAVLTLDTVHGR